MADRGGKLHVAHSLSANLAASDFDATALANDSLVLNLLVAAASALPVLYWTKDALTEETVPLWLKRAVIDGLRFLDLAMRPAEDVFPAGDSNLNCIKLADVWHVLFSFLLNPSGVLVFFQTALGFQLLARGISFREPQAKSLELFLTKESN